MRISDWSSDVCSSDLALGGGVDDALVGMEQVGLAVDRGRTDRVAGVRCAPEDACRALGPVLHVDHEQLLVAGHLAAGVEAGAVGGGPGLVREEERGLAGGAQLVLEEIGRATVWTPVTNAPLACRLQLEKKRNRTFTNYQNSRTTD